MVSWMDGELNRQESMLLLTTYLDKADRHLFFVCCGWMGMDTWGVRHTQHSLPFCQALYSLPYSPLLPSTPSIYANNIDNSAIASCIHGSALSPNTINLFAIQTVPVSHRHSNVGSHRNISFLRIRQLFSAARCAHGPCSRESRQGNTPLICPTGGRTPVVIWFILVVGPLRRCEAGLQSAV